MVDKYLYAYGDETGDLGFAFNRGSSHYFAIALILTNYPERIMQEVQHLRQALELSSKAEFKFHAMSNHYRSHFLVAIQPLPISVHVLVVDKTKLTGSWQKIDNPTFYALCLTELIKRIPQNYFYNTILTLDQFGSIPATKLAIQRELKRLGKRPFRHIHMKRSQGNDLIQCADMIAGAVMRSWQRQDSQFLQLIDDKVTIWQFPENKNPPS